MRQPEKSGLRVTDELCADALTMLVEVTSSGAPTFMMRLLVDKWLRGEE